MVERKWWVEVSVETRRRVHLLLASLWLCEKWVEGLQVRWMGVCQAI